MVINHQFIWQEVTVAAAVAVAVVAMVLAGRVVLVRQADLVKEPWKDQDKDQDRDRTHQ
jgi:hypothetical protein